MSVPVAIDSVTEIDPSSNSDDVRFWLTALLTELRLTQAHYNSLSALAAAAQRGEWFYDYGDFMELVLDAHAAAVLVGVGRLLDRDPRTASVHWLVRLVEERPDEFAVAPEQLREAIKALEVGVSAVRTVRNKLVAHRERSAPSEARELRRAYPRALTETNEILRALDKVVAAVISSDRVRDWRFTMIAMEPWVEDVLAALEAGRADSATRGRDH